MEHGQGLGFKGRVPCACELDKEFVHMDDRGCATMSGMRMRAIRPSCNAGKFLYFMA